jgi:hypothetical protein
MIKNILKLFLILVFFSCSPTQDFSIKKIEEAKPNSPELKYEFPLLVGKSRHITKKINSEIIKDFLDIDINKAHKSIFQNVWGPKEYSIPLLSDLTYNINVLNKKMYSLTLNAEGCGAYCESFSTSYNYDLSNGHKIYLESIFSKKGKKELLLLISREKRKEIENYILKINNEVDSKQDKEIITQTIELYKNCLNSLPFNSLEFIDFKIIDKTIVLTSERCSNHAEIALDELDDYQFIYKQSEINSHLNKYGKNILK